MNQNYAYSQYLIFDSFSKDRSSDISNGKMSWNLVLGGAATSSGSGTPINKYLTNITNITAGEFILPVIRSYTFEYSSDLPGTLLLEQNNGAAEESSYTIPQFSHFGKFSLSINETGVQSMANRDGSRFNFEYKTLPRILPISHDDTTLKTVYGAEPITDFVNFTLSNPIPEITNLTLNFTIGGVPIKFDPDCLYGCLAEISDDYVRFTYRDHGLLTGDKIFIEGFDSGNSILNSYMMRKEGHIIGGEPGLSTESGLTPGDNYFWTDPSVNTKNITVTKTSFICTVLVEKRRIRIPIKFECIEPKYKY